MSVIEYTSHLRKFENVSGPGSIFFQPKLTINNSNDKYEHEADAVANKVMQMEAPSLQAKQNNNSFFAPSPISITPVQRKCEACEEEQKMQRKEIETGAATADNNLENYIGSLSSGGQPLPNEVRNFYEPRFGYDFSNVKIHTDTVATKSAQSINALAYTSGNNIVFNNGQYSPNTDSGKKLLGHELTHVVQQGNGNNIQTKKYVQNKNIIQRAYWMGVDAAGKEQTGTALHNLILGDFGSDPKNKNLFTEAPVPNADLKSADFDKIGSADFYTGDTTVGLRFKANADPEYLESNPKLKRGGSKFPHKKNAAPVYKNKEIDVSNAPAEIKVGDLKPFGAEELDPKYEEQLDNYVAGFAMVKSEIEGMNKDPQQMQKVKGQKNWSVKIGKMGAGSMEIPDKYKIASTSATSWRIILKDGRRKYFLRQRITGKLFVAYRKDQTGIWNYVWVPDTAIDVNTIPESVRNMQLNLNTLTDPLRDTRLQAKSKNGATQLAMPNTRIPIQRKTPAQKTPEKKDRFDLVDWETKWDSFQKGVKAIPNNDIENADAKVKGNKTQEELNSKFNGIPGDKNTEEGKKNVKLVKQIHFWSSPFSKVVGKFRKIFGTTFAKAYSAVEFIKEKVSGLLKSAKRAGSSGGLLGAVIKLFIKIFKIAGKFLFERTINLVMNSLTQGFAKKVEAFIDELIPDDVEAYIAKIKTIQEEYEAGAVGEVVEMIEKISGPYMDLPLLIQEIEEKAQTFEKIISLVRWGARIIACASPPAIGCLWALAQSVIEAIAARVVNSCWFTKKVGVRVAGTLMEFEKIKNIPINAAGFIIEKINSLMPRGWEKTFAVPEKSQLDAIQPEYDNSCDEGGGTSSGVEEFSDTRQAIFDCMLDVGEERFNGMLEMMVKQGAGPWVLLTKERIKKIQEDLKKTDPGDLKKVADGKEPSSPLPQSLQNLNTEIANYTAKEKKTQEDFFEGKRAKEETVKLKEEERKKIIEVLKTPFPSDADLIKELKSFNWSQIATGSVMYIISNNQLLIFIKTNAGARIGAFAKHIERSEKKQQYWKIVDVADFITLDEVKSGDGFGFITKNMATGEANISFDLIVLDKPIPPLGKLTFKESFLSTNVPVVDK
jgi:hypothetical protein